MNSSLSSRYREILKRVSSGALLIAVSKSQSVDQIEELYRLGHRDFGENYAQELLEKAPELSRRGCTEIRWHFIGHLQTNKIKAILPYVACIHTIDSVRLAMELSKRCAALGRVEKLPVFIQVNLDQEESKTGFLPEVLLQEIMGFKQVPGLSIQGLMCIPSVKSNARAAFKQLRDLESQLQPITQGKLSMGMSHDFEIAIQEGATHVRVGTALFGSR